MSRIALVACASAKTNAPSAPAGEMYVSDLFLKSRKWALQNSDRWYILSAKYGLLEPSQRIEQYNVTLNTMSVAARRVWSRDVLKSILANTAAGDELIFLAGKNYRNFLEQPLAEGGYTIRVPMEGKRIGEQLQWLSQHIR